MLETSHWTNILTYQSSSGVPYNVREVLFTCLSSSQLFSPHYPCCLPNSLLSLTVPSQVAILAPKYSHSVLDALLPYIAQPYTYNTHVYTFVTRCVYVCVHAHTQEWHFSWLIWAWNWNYIKWEKKIKIELLLSLECLMILRIIGLNLVRILLYM